MSNLEEFTPYTSYRLHWFPCEIRRCKNLKRSTVSTRALCGNYRHRPPFPRLPQHSEFYRPKTCSICSGEFDEAPMQRWTSRRMGSDIVPLLVHACSDACVDSIKDAPDNYVERPHSGGPDRNAISSIEKVGGAAYSSMDRLDLSFSKNFWLSATELRVPSIPSDKKLLAAIGALPGLVRIEITNDYDPLKVQRMRSRFPRVKIEHRFEPLIDLIR